MKRNGRVIQSGASTPVFRPLTPSVKPIPGSVAEHEPWYGQQVGSASPQQQPALVVAVAAGQLWVGKDGRAARPVHQLVGRSGVWRCTQSIVLRGSWVRVRTDSLLITFLPSRAQCKL